MSKSKKGAIRSTLKIEEEGERKKVKRQLRNAEKPSPRSAKVQFPNEEVYYPEDIENDRSRSSLL